MAIPLSDPSPEEQQTLVILAGVVGSGKSTLSSAWSKALPNWVRVNQDDLGDRRTCEQVLKSHLSQGRSVVLDRQNFDRGQRRTWLEIANEFPTVRVVGMVMGTSIDDCRTRLRNRQNHPTIDNAQLALSLLDKFTSLWEEPQLDEGFDKLMTLPSLPPSSEIDSALILSLLSTLYASPKNPLAREQRQRKPPPPRSSYGFGSGQGQGGSGSSPANTMVYRRSDGFVDDGTWRPPPRPSHLPHSNVQYSNAPSPATSQQTWGYQLLPSILNPSPSYYQQQPQSNRTWGQQQPPNRSTSSSTTTSSNRWNHGPPHQWGSNGRTLGGSSGGASSQSLGSTNQQPQPPS